MATAAGFALLALAPWMDSTAASFTPLGPILEDVIFPIPTAISGDGNVVTGYGVFNFGGGTCCPFRWTPGGSIETLFSAGPTGGGETPAALSGDGGVVVGRYHSSAVNSSGQHAFRWTSAGGPEPLGDFAGDPVKSDALGVSADGNVVVGYGTVPDSSHHEGARAFRWTSETGLEGIGDLPGGSDRSIAYGISADGSVIVGQSGSSNGTEAFRWTASDGTVSLGDLPDGRFISGAYAVSADGTVIVGAGSGPIQFEQRAFRWTATGGMQSLDDTPGRNSFARAVSADGSVVTGEFRPINTAGDPIAFVWTQQGGMMALADVLVAAGATGLAGWSLHAAPGISEDGQWITGWGTSPEGNRRGFLANITPDQDLDGIADAADNCLLDANPDQCDSDGDGFGNRCDADLNNNGHTNAQDSTMFRQQLGQPSPGPGYNPADFDCDGVVNARDTVLFRQRVGSPPGPSGVMP